MRELCTGGLARPKLTISDKIFLFLQALFGNIEVEDKKSSENASIKATIMAIYKDAPRIVKGKLSDWIITDISYREHCETQGGDAGQAIWQSRQERP
jgi:hypothetical protein